MIRRLDMCAINETVQLCDLCVFQALITLIKLPDWTGISHIFGQEGCEHFITDIVMRLYIQQRVRESVCASRQSSDGGCYGGSQGGRISQLITVLYEELPYLETVFHYFGSKTEIPGKS